MRNKLGLFVSAALLGMLLCIAGSASCRAQDDILGGATGGGATGAGALGSAIGGSLSRAGNAVSASPTPVRTYTYSSGHAYASRHARHSAVHHTNATHHRVVRRVHAKRHH